MIIKFQTSESRINMEIKHYFCNQEVICDVQERRQGILMVGRGGGNMIMGEFIHV